MDLRRLAKANALGAAGTFFASAVVAMLSATLSEKSGRWVWYLILALGFVALFLIWRAVMLWRAGINPLPPRKTTPVTDLLRAADWWFPRLDGPWPFCTAFLQDARNGRHRLWGRLKSDDWVDEMKGGDKLPLVFIPQEYWTSAKIDWLKGVTEPVGEGEPVYHDLIVGKQSLRLKLAIDWMKNRYSLKNKKSS